MVDWIGRLVGSWLPGWAFLQAPFPSSKLSVMKNHRSPFKHPFAIPTHVSSGLDCPTHKHVPDFHGERWNSYFHIETGPGFVGNAMGRKKQK